MKQVILNYAQAKEEMKSCLRSTGMILYDPRNERLKQICFQFPSQIACVFRLELACMARYKRKNFLLETGPLNARIKLTKERKELEARNEDLWFDLFLA
jgi:hypothetical protein